MSRTNQGGRRSGRRSMGPTLFQLVLALSASRPYFNADLYVIDGGSGKMRAAADYNGAGDTHWLDQSDTTKQCALPAVHADFANRLCITCDGTVGPYTSTRAAALFPYVQDGSGVTGLSVFTPLGTGNRVLWGTTSTANANGLSHYVNSSHVARAAVYKTGAALVAEASAGATPAGTPTYTILRHSSGSSPQYDWRLKGASVSSGSYLSTPTAGAPSHTLRFGHNTGPNLVFNGRARELVGLFPYLSDAQLETVQEYVSTLGIAA